MKVRSVYFNDFRNFRGEHTISFMNELTGDVHPLSVLAGSNGSGKTTVLEAITETLRYANNPGWPGELIESAFSGGWICVELDFGAAELTWLPDVSEPVRVHIALGDLRSAPPDRATRWPNLIAQFGLPGGGGDFIRTGVFERQPNAEGFPLLQGRVDRNACPGVLYLPSARRLHGTVGGPIAPPPERPSWIERVEGSPEWEGSIEQLLVWRNYLDLEQGTADGSRLRAFTDRLNSVLGSERRVSIREGRVLVSTGVDGMKPVRLAQLPSGEQQMLLVCSEVLRRASTGLVCLIDEPELSLHPAAQHALVGALRRMGREFGLQFILATHSIEVVSALPTSAVFLDEELRRNPAPKPVQEQAA